MPRSFPAVHLRRGPLQGALADRRIAGPTALPVLRATSRVLTAVGSVPLVAAVAKLTGTDSSSMVSSPEPTRPVPPRRGRCGRAQRTCVTLLDAHGHAGLNVTGEMVLDRRATLAADLRGDVRLDALEATTTRGDRCSNTSAGSSVWCRCSTSCWIRTVHASPHDRSAFLAATTPSEAGNHRDRLIAIVNDAGNRPVSIVTMKDLVEVLTANWKPGNPESRPTTAAT